MIDTMSARPKSKPWKQYRPIFMTWPRIGGGITFYRANRGLLDRIAEKNGVDPQNIVAIIGIESNYGPIPMAIGCWMR